jgi:hypothetical protein
VTLKERHAIEARLVELTDKGNGILTPEAVVKDAANKRSPLHARIFRESDQDAAHAHRLELARQLIRTVMVNIKINRRTIRVVGYVHDPASKSKAGYVPTISLVNERERALETIQHEFERIESIIRRSREIADVLDLSDELESLLENIVRFVEKARKRAA